MSSTPTIAQSPFNGRDALNEYGVVAEVRMAPASNTQEYVTSGRFNTQVTRDTAEILATHSDEILRWLGPRAYDRMELDAEVSKCIRILKTYVLSDGVEFSPAVPEQDPLFEAAKGISDFTIRSENNLSISLRDIFEQMLDSMKYGHKVAEITFDFVPEDSGVEDAGLYHLKHIKVLKQGAVAFVRDKFKNVLGFKVPTTEQNQKLKVIPRNKFFVITFRGVDSDPRGISILRAAYQAWHIKMMVLPDYVLWLKHCAVPGLVGITSAENDAKNYVRDANGNPKMIDGKFVTVPATSQLADALQSMRNASAIAIPAGSQVLPINNSVSSEPFKTNIDLMNEEIEMSILLQTLATSDSRHNTRAASQTAMTVLDVLVFDIKNIVLEAFKRDVLKRLVEVNKDVFAKKFGITEEQVMKLVPKASLGDSERSAWSRDITAVTNAYEKGVIKESQLPSIYRQLGLVQAAEEEHLLKVRETAAKVDIAEAEAKIAQATEPAPLGRKDARTSA